MKWSKYKSDKHKISSPLTSFIDLYFLFILFYFSFFHVNRKAGTGVCFVCSFFVSM